VFINIHDIYIYIYIYIIVIFFDQLIGVCMACLSNFVYFDDDLIRLTSTAYHLADRVIINYFHHLHSNLW
jgi:MFS superfamily sulfate permease-like transporter